MVQINICLIGYRTVPWNDLQRHLSLKNLFIIDFLTIDEPEMIPCRGGIFICNLFCHFLEASSTAKSNSSHKGKSLIKSFHMKTKSKSGSKNCYNFGMCQCIIIIIIITMPIYRNNGTHLSVSRPIFFLFVYLPIVFLRVWLHSNKCSNSDSDDNCNQLVILKYY